MIYIFENFAVEHVALPEGWVSVKYHEAMEGVSEDGTPGIVGTGHVFAVKFNQEQAANHCIEVAIKAGLMEDKDKPEVADLSQMREEIKKRRRPKR